MQLEDGLHFPAKQILFAISTLLFICRSLSLSRYPTLPLAPRRFPLSILHISACIVCLAARILTRDELLWLISHKKRNRNRFWSWWNQRARCSCLCVCCFSWRVIDGFPLNAFIYREDKLWRWKWHIERVAHVYISRSSSISVSLSLFASIHFWLFEETFISRDHAMTWWWRWQCWPNNKHSPKIYNNKKISKAKKYEKHKNQLRNEALNNTMQCDALKINDFIAYHLGEAQCLNGLCGCSAANAY